MTTAVPTIREHASADLLSEHDWARAWQGHWIGPQPVHQSALKLGGSAHKSGFSRRLYRGSFDLAYVPETAPLRITADSRYALFVNGSEAGRGPVRSQPRRLRYDSYDVAPLLREGTNLIVVLVTYYGTANSFWQPAAGTGNFGTGGILALELRTGAGWFGSDARWQVRDAVAWSAGPRSSSDKIPVEQFDARLLEHDWSEGTSGEWEPAYPQPVVHLGGLARTRPPGDPYGALLPRPIGALGGAAVVPATAALGEAHPAEKVGESPVEHVLGRWSSASRAMTPVISGSIRFFVDSPTSRAVEFDFKRIVAGRVAFTLDAPAGTTVDLLYREAAPNAVGDGQHAIVPKTGARYIARGTNDEFIAQEINGFRFAHLLITVPSAGEVRLQDFRVEEFLYRPTGSAYFRSSDHELDSLYSAGVRTVELNSHDAYTDCPTREQRAWVGDGVVHQMVSLTTSNDWRLPRWYVELGNSPRPDGILPMSVAGEIESAQGYTIPDWSLYWIHGLHNIYRYTGDHAALAAAAPTARRILEWYVPYLTDEGVLADVPEWNLVDWSSIFLNGSSSILTALWAAELREFAEISDYLGNGGDAAWARSLWERARVGYRIFWDEERGTYVDHLVAGEKKPAASQLAGALAINSGLAPEGRIARIVQWISDPQRQVTRSWIGGHGFYDVSKMLEQVRGVQRIDWNAEEETVVAEPFASFLVHDAYAIAGRPDLLVANMRRWSTFLQDGYDTFGECWGWGTPAHGWSSTPTRDLIQRVVGVTPELPGFVRARIAPAYGLIEHMEAAAPTPHGLITVTVRGESVTIESPVPFTLVLPDRSESRQPAGTATFG